MKQAIRRALTLVLALCLAALPALSAADTYLPDGEVTHVDFTLAAAVHPEGFPATQAHLADWAAFLKKLDIRGAMDALAMLDPQSRVYLSGALRLNGQDQVPFVYDGYHSYRYFISPALGNEVFYFQMHNFLEFMLKPYYYMELPTQYIGLLMYPEAAVYLADSYFTPVADMMAAAREDAAAQAEEAREALLTALADAQATVEADLAHAQARITELDAAMAALTAATLVPEPTAVPVPEPTAVPVTEAPATEAAPATDAPAADASATESAAPVTNLPATEVPATATPAPTAMPAPTPDMPAMQAERDTLAARIAELTGRQAQLADAAENSDTMTNEALLAALPAYAAEADADTDAPAMDVPEGASVYNVPYEKLYELCETLDMVENDDPELERVYFFFTCLLIDSLSSDLVVDTLGRLEDTLDALDPEQAGMTVVETADSLTCTIGETEVFSRQSTGGVTQIALTLPTADDYDINLRWRWDENGAGASLDAKAALVMNGADAAALTLTGEGLPRADAVSGQGRLRIAASGSNFAAVPLPIDLAFDWARNAKEKPYTLGLTIDWLHPATGLPAVSLDFNGTFSAADRSVFVEGKYPQNDFFNLNEMFLSDYKDRLMLPLALKLTPILLETPAGVINDVYAYMQQTDILVSLVE